MTPIEIRLLRLPHGDDLPLPAYQSAHAAGFDLHAAVPADTPLVIAPGERAHDPDRHCDCATARNRRTGASALRTWQSGTGSPCSTRPEPSMPTTAEKYK